MFAFKCRCSLAWELANLIIILNTQPRPTQFASSELFTRQGQWREMLPESSSKIAVSKSHRKKLSKLSARLQSLLKELSNGIDLTARRLIDRQIDCGLVIKWIVLTIGKLIHQMGKCNRLKNMHVASHSFQQRNQFIFVSISSENIFLSLEASRRLVPNESDFLAEEAGIAINKCNCSMFLKMQPPLYCGLICDKLRIRWEKGEDKRGVESRCQNVH